MSGTVLTLETLEGIYKIGCLVPQNRNNSELLPPYRVERCMRQDGSVNLAAIPKGYEHLLIGAIAEDFFDPEDESDMPDFYRVLSTPLAGSVHEKDGVGLIIKVAQEKALRVYHSAPVDEVVEEIQLTLSPPEEVEAPAPATSMPALGAPDEKVRTE